MRPKINILAPMAESKVIEYVILSTPEEDALNNYFLMLSRFAFDTARDQAVSSLTWCWW